MKVVGKAVDRGGGHGMDVPSSYIFVGQKTNIDMLIASCWIFPITYLLGLKALNVVKKERQKREAGIKSKNSNKTV